MWVHVYQILKVAMEEGVGINLSSALFSQAKLHIQAATSLGGKEKCK